MQFRDHPAVGGKRDFYPVDPRALKVDASYNVRDMDSADTKEHVAELKGLIKESGVRTPLEVRLEGDDIFVVAGHCRLAAVMELIGEGIEIKTVPCIPEPKGTGVEERTLNLHLSNNGKPLTALERAKIVKRLHDFGWAPAEIARRMNWKSVASVEQHLSMVALPEPVKQRVRDGKEAATLAVQLEKENPEFAAELRRANEEENKKLGVGVRPKKLTPMAVRKAKQERAPKADPKPVTMTDPTRPLDATEPGETPAPAIDTNEAAALATDEALGASNLFETVVEGERPSPVRAFPAEAMHPPGKAFDFDREMFAIIARLATIGEDNCLAERGDDETIPVPAEVIKAADRAYRSRISDEIAA